MRVAYEIVNDLPEGVIAHGRAATPSNCVARTAEAHRSRAGWTEPNEHWEPDVRRASLGSSQSLAAVLGFPRQPRPKPTTTLHPNQSLSVECPLHGSRRSTRLTPEPRCRPGSSFPRRRTESGHASLRLEDRADGSTGSTGSPRCARTRKRRRSAKGRDLPSHSGDTCSSSPPRGWPTCQDGGNFGIRAVVPARKPDNRDMSPIAASPKPLPPPGGSRSDFPWTNRRGSENHLAPNGPIVQAGDHDRFVVNGNDRSHAVGGDQLTAANAPDLLHAIFAK